jgi:acyl-CoA thioesterase-1
MPSAARSVAVSLSLLAIAACSVRDAACGRPVTREPTPDEVAIAETGTNAPALFSIVFLGDSLTAGLGLLSDQAYPGLIREQFAAEGYSNVEIVNAGISGDTTAGGAQRVEWLLDQDVRILVVALGGNDALRGLPVGETRENLAAIIETAQDAGVMVLLAGMEAPTNLGEEYRQAFRAAFAQLALAYPGIEYMPFLLEGVAAEPTLNQPDGIHPNEQGAAIIAENMYPRLRMMVDSLGGGG